MKGKCPDRGTLLVKDAQTDGSLDNRQVRCPSCRKHFHRLAELEWSE